MGLKDGLDDLVNPITESIEEFQNTLTLKSHEHLYKYIKSDNWLSKQIASQKDLQKSLIGIANAEAKKINRNYEEAFRLALKSGNEPISKGAIERLNKIKTDNAKMMLALTNQVYQSHQKWVNEIGLKANEKREIGKMEKSNSLFNQITDVLNSKKVEDEVKVVYKGGREVSFKTYMEMNVRTTMNQEIGRQQMEAAETLGVVFWLCNSFEDCRTQHIEFQGKVYYDERYVNYGFDAETIKQIEDAIDSREMMSRQEVENDDPFLSNCPNCRHEFMAIPIEDVIDKSDKELLEENGLNIDKATEQKYQLSQEQRLYERKIREYRLKVQQNQMELSKASYGIDTESVKKNLAHNQMMLDRYYGNIRGLVRKHSFLERDYKRESARVLRSDLGASSKYMAQAKPTIQKSKKSNDEILQDYSYVEKKTINDTNLIDEKIEELSAKAIGLYYDKNYIELENEVTDKFIREHKLTVTIDKDGLTNCKFTSLKDAKEYMDILKYTDKECDTFNPNNQKDIELYLSAVKNAQKYINDIPMSNGIISLANSINKNVVFETQDKSINRDGTYCHIGRRHSDNFTNLTIISKIKHFISTAKPEERRINEKDSPNRYVFYREDVDNEDKNICLIFEKDKNGTLLFFNGYIREKSKKEKLLTRKNKKNKM